MLLYVLNTQVFEKQSSIAHFAIVAKDGLLWLYIVTSPQLICDVTWTRDFSIVTSYSSIVLARANWHKGNLHLSIITVNIDFSSPGIHGVACKKYNSSYYQHQIGSIKHFPLLSYFPWLCVWGGRTIMRCLFHTHQHTHTHARVYIYIYVYIYIPGKLCFASLITMQSYGPMMCANNRVHYGLMVIYGYYHPFLSWWLWEYLYSIISSSSNQKYDPFAIV